MLTFRWLIAWVITVDILAGFNCSDNITLSAHNSTIFLTSLCWKSLHLRNVLPFLPLAKLFFCPWLQKPEPASYKVQWRKELPYAAACHSPLFYNKDQTDNKCNGYKAESASSFQVGQTFITFWDETCSSSLKLLKIINELLFRMIPWFMTEKYWALRGIEPDASQFLVKCPNH